MLVNLLLGLATFTAIYFFGDKMMLAFTKDPEVIRIGKEYLLIMGGFFIVHGGLNVFNGALRGAGDTLFPMAVSITCLWLIRIPSPIGLALSGDGAVSGGPSAPAFASGLQSPISIINWDSGRTKGLYGRNKHSLLFVSIGVASPDRLIE